MWKCLTRRWVFVINTINYYKSPALPVCGNAWLVDEYFLLILLIIINFSHYLYVEVLDSSMSIFINTINYYKSPALPVCGSAWLVDEYCLLILLIIINLPHYLYVEVLDSSMSIFY